MLEGYHEQIVPAGTTVEQNQRLLAVQAALEIAKASASSSNNANGGTMYTDLDNAAKYIESLADAIQEALK